VSPAESLLNAIRSHLRESGLFQAVADRGSLVKPDTLMEVHVSQLYGDFRDPSKLLLSSASGLYSSTHRTKPEPRPLQKTYSRRVPFRHGPLRR